MAYTTTEIIQRHLASDCPVTDRVTDQPLTLAGTNPVRFWGGAVEPESVWVKSVQATQPERVAITVADDGALIAQTPIVAGSVVVASDSSLGSVYVENIDYTVDYTAARLYRKNGGAIAGGQNVCVWFIPYVLYAAEEDYRLDSQTAEIRRMAGGKWLPARPCFWTLYQSSKGMIRSRFPQPSTKPMA